MPPCKSTATILHPLTVGAALNAPGQRSFHNGFRSPLLLSTVTLYCALPAVGTLTVYETIPAAVGTDAALNPAPALNQREGAPRASQTAGLSPVIAGRNRSSNTICQRVRRAANTCVTMQKLTSFSLP